jgi:hypothetical protein
MALLIDYSKEMLNALEERMQVAENSKQRSTQHANLLLIQGTIWSPSQCLCRPNVQTSSFALWRVP